MMFSGRSMGGGDVGGLLRTFGRAVTRVGVSGIQDPLSSSTVATSPRSPKSATSPSLSSVNCHTQNSGSRLPFPCSSYEVTDFDWVTVDGLDGFEDEGFNGFSDSYVLTNPPSPSQHEVDDALVSLQEVFCSTSHSQHNNDNCGLRNDVADNVTIPDLNPSVMDWKEPSTSPYDPRMRPSSATNKVYHAFHLLETEPTVQKMVKSISSDSAVWEAVLNNEVVRELRDSASSEDKSVSQSSNGTSTGSESHPTTTNVVMWIFDSSRAKFMELIEMITNIVTDMFQPANHKTNEVDFLDPFTDKLRTSFMLSIIVILVVVVGRAKSS